MSPREPHAALWVRLRHRFGPRRTEWMLAVITALWGAVLLLPAETFDGAVYSYFRALFGGEGRLGGLMLCLGLLRLGGLIVNGARRRTTSWIRAVSAGFGFMIFVGISTSFALSGVISTWLAVYPVFALFELVNLHQATHDAGGGHATA